MRKVMCVIAFILLAILGGEAAQAETLRVGKSPAYLFAYVPLDVGIETGIFKKRGVDIEPVVFGGAAKMDLAMTADSIDVGMGSPMEFAALTKGMPAVAIGVVAGPMLEFGIIVPFDLPAKQASDLKGKRFGIATEGSITQWAVFELARVNGWKRNEFSMVAIGGDPGAAAAAMKTHLVDASVHNVMQDLAMQKAGIARMLFTVADYADHFVAHTMMAATKTVREKPDALRRFLAGYYEAVAYMQAHKPETVAIARRVTGLSEADEQEEYDLLMPGLPLDGHFDPLAITRIGQSLTELGIVDHAPDMSKLYDESFLPPRASP